jgi:hypothetical protein
MQSERRKRKNDEIEQWGSESNMCQSELLMEVSKVRIDSLIVPN